MSSIRTKRDLGKSALRISGFTWAVFALIFKGSDVFIPVSNLLATIVFFTWSVFVLPFQVEEDFDIDSIFDCVQPSDLFKRFQVGFSIAILTSTIVYYFIHLGLNIQPFYAKISAVIAVYVALLAWTLRWPPGKMNGARQRSATGLWE